MVIVAIYKVSKYPTYNTQQNGGSSPVEVMNFRMLHSFHLVVRHDSDGGRVVRASE